MIARKEFTLPIYGVPYEVAIVTTLEEARAIDSDFPENQEARTVWNDDTNLDLKMIFGGHSDENAYAHECVHLANRIWLLLGYTPERDNDEPNAYLVGHLMSTVMEVRREYDFRMKREKFKEEAKDD